MLIENAHICSIFFFWLIKIKELNAPRLTNQEFVFDEFSSSSSSCFCDSDIFILNDYFKLFFHFHFHPVTSFILIFILFLMILFIFLIIIFILMPQSCPCSHVLKGIIPAEFSQLELFPSTSHY